MPHLNGIELCQVILQRSALERTTSAVFTAHAEADTVEQIFAAGADDCVRASLGPKLVTNL